MPTNEEVVTQTSNATSTPRSVSVLLHVLETDGTYQGMTDEEIQSIVNYEKQISHMQGVQEQMDSEYSNHCASMQALTTTALQEQETMLQSIISRASNPQLQVIQYG